jgi:hypothetical protein
VAQSVRPHQIRRNTDRKVAHRLAKFALVVVILITHRLAKSLESGLRSLSAWAPSSSTYRRGPNHDFEHSEGRILM